LSVRPHNYSIGKPEQLFRLNCTRRMRRKRAGIGRRNSGSVRHPIECRRFRYPLFSAIAYFMAARALS
jgi:hypothetical protein